MEKLKIAQKTLNEAIEQATDKATIETLSKIKYQLDEVEQEEQQHEKDHKELLEDFKQSVLFNESRKKPEEPLVLENPIQSQSFDDIFKAAAEKVLNKKN